MSVLDAIFPSRVRRRKLAADVAKQRAVIQAHFEDISRTLSIDTNAPEYRRLINEHKQGGA